MSISMLYSICATYLTLSPVGVSDKIFAVFFNRCGNFTARKVKIPPHSKPKKEKKWDCFAGRFLNQIDVLYTFYVETECVFILLEAN